MQTGLPVGRWYSRAAIVLWPKEHRKLVNATTVGEMRGGKGGQGGAASHGGGAASAAAGGGGG